MARRRRSRPDPRWTLQELSAQVTLALAEGYEGQRNGQVRDVPNARTIRYYTTLGLLDRPAEMRGRTAYYGPRHLRQLVGIKRLQAQGLPLVAVQKRLAGMTGRQLEILADLPAELQVERDGAAPPAADGGERDAFWSRPPAELAEAGELPSKPPNIHKGDATEARTGARTLQDISLAPGVSLLLQSRESLSDEDLAALRDAAAPLLEWLAGRRRVAPSHRPPGKEPT